MGAGLRLWDTCKKTLCLALEYIKNCPLGVSFVTFGSVAQPVRFWFKSLTVHERQFLQGNIFLLAVCMHEVPLYLCSIFCSHSLVQVGTVSYHVLSMEHNCILKIDIN